MASEVFPLVGAVEPASPELGDEGVAVLRWRADPICGGGHDVDRGQVDPVCFAEAPRFAFHVLGGADLGSARGAERSHMVERLSPYLSSESP